MVESLSNRNHTSENKQIMDHRKTAVVMWLSCGGHEVIWWSPGDHVVVMRWSWGGHEVVTL